MTTADILTEYLQCRGGDAVSVTDGTDRLRIVAGRPGSVCFTLHREVAPSVSLTLAEGFTLDGRLHYTQRTLPEAAVEGIIRALARALPATSLPSVAEPPEMLGAAADA